MSKVNQIKDRYYIQASSSPADERRRVLKQGETFAVFDRRGDIQQLGFGEQGIYYGGTRYVCRLTLKLGDVAPMLLSSTVRQDNTLLVVDLENPDFSDQTGRVVPRGTLHLVRSKLLWEGCCYERCRITNYGRETVHVELSYEFASDFVDLFEVRGATRERRGRLSEPSAERNRVTVRYEGLDGVVRTACFEGSPRPAKTTPASTQFRLKIKPRQSRDLFFLVTCRCGERPRRRPTFRKALATVERTIAGLAGGDCRIFTSNEQFNDWVNRSFADLRMMVTKTPQGWYPYAGVPWYSTAFGRDGIITALEVLWASPESARGVLGHLAATQADSLSPERDAEPGKILHERREGEMAALGEVPFGRYYGSVDATPLFVVLAGRYYRRTGDRAFIESIWPNIERVLQWLDKWGDPDRDGFVEYSRRSKQGLVNQGWKDSADSVFHADGAPADGPIALCEVQGYVYDAKRQAAYLASILDKPKLAWRLDKQASQLKKKFEEAFWCEDLSSYALALDGDKRPCRVLASNAGHALFSGIAGEEHAPALARLLLSDAFFSGWGIRTVAASQARYNPMSYHNGSIWPHDNALIAAGLRRYGFRDGVVKLFTGLFDASIFVDLNRLPELFCGFPRRPREGPTLYPVACSPQSWASASVFSMLQSCLGLSIDAPEGLLRFDYPVLPTWLEEVRIENLRVGEAAVDLRLLRHPDDVGINVTRRKGEVDVVVRK